MRRQKLKARRQKIKIDLTCVKEIYTIQENCGERISSEEDLISPPESVPVSHILLADSSEIINSKDKTRAMYNMCVPSLVKIL